MLKMIRQFTFHHPKQIIAPTLWLFLSQAFSILPAILAYMAIYLLGQAFYPPYTLDIALLIKIAIIGIAYVLLQYAVELISYYNTYGRAYHDTADKRITYIQKLRRQNLGFFSSKESGELISSFASDFANVEYTMCFWLPYPIGIGFLLLLSFVCMLFFDWRMAVAIFAMLPICTILMLQIAKVKEKHSRSVMEAKTRAATQLNEYLHGMKDLKAYHRTGSGFEALKKAFSDLRRESLLDEAVAGSLSTLCASLVKFVVPVTATVGLYLLMGGSLTILDFAGFLVIATKLTEPALTLVSSISALRGMALSGERLDKVMTMPDPSGEDKISHGDSYAFDSVSFHYAADSNVIHGVSFETPAGALTALVGPSGSGKSTLLRLMARFWDYQQGQVRFAGKELRSIAPESLLSQVSMVMQNAYLFRGTIRENLCFGNECITEQQMLDACRKARCHDFVSALPEGYDTVVGEGGATLSGGERQRISLARAFLKDVPILLLDEPTASLDADNEAMVQRALDEISKERTIIMIAHRLKTVRGAQQILVLENGRITQKEPITSLSGQTDSTHDCGNCKIRLETILSNNLRRRNMKSKFLNLKEFVLVLLLACLETVIGLVAAMPFAANLQLVYFLVPGLTGLINGIIYVLLIKKCPKVGTQFIIPFVYGLLFLFSGSVYVFMFFAILAVANELIMIGGYGKKVRQAIPHVLTWSLNSMGSTLTLLLFRDSMVQTYVKMGMSAVDAEAAVSSVEGFWLAPQNIAIALAAAAILSVAGYALGMKMFSKHFKPAGIA